MARARSGQRTSRRYSSRVYHPPSLSSHSPPLNCSFQVFANTGSLPGPPSLAAVHGGETSSWSIISKRPAWNGPGNRSPATSRYCAICGRESLVMSSIQANNPVVTYSSPRIPSCGRGRRAIPRERSALDRPSSPPSPRPPTYPWRLQNSTR